ncbi:hypothetical protein HG531_006016 [Fusarium graminearum]|nr:hypothetical protein HG531_006016 [Fusarium graminearum]
MGVLLENTSITVFESFTEPCGQHGEHGGEKRSRGLLGRLDNGGKGRSRGGSLGLSGGRGRGSGARARARAGRGSLPDLGAGERVGLGVVDVKDNTLVGVSVTGLEVEVLIGDGSARSSDLNLSARGVELSTTGAVVLEGNIGLVTGDDLLADDVLAGLEAGGESEGSLALVLDELVDSPLATLKTILGDLGPDSTGTIGLGVRGDVGDDGTLVRAINDIVTSSVVVPLEGDLVTGSSGGKLGSSLSTVDVADNVGAGQVLDGVVVLGRSDVGVATITEVLSVDPEAVDLSVGRDGGGHGQSSGGSSETHLDRFLWCYKNL